jgi:hypothetical protein
VVIAPSTLIHVAPPLPSSTRSGNPFPPPPPRFSPS